MRASSSVDVSRHGFAGDRRWSFIRNDVPQSGFPWLTLRERGDMSHYHPVFVDPKRPDKSATIVGTPLGMVLDAFDPTLAAPLGPGGVRAIKHDRGIFDTFPVSLISTHSITRLGEMTGVSLEVQRCRPNILVDVSGETPFDQDSRVGCVLRIGGFPLRVGKRDGCCAVITIDPMTPERNIATLRTVSQNRQGCIGVYRAPARISDGHSDGEIEALWQKPDSDAHKRPL